MGKFYCSMPNCSNFKGKIGKFGLEVKLHKLPSNKAQRRAWIRAISRKNWTATGYTRVCSDHFSNGVGPSRKDEENKIPTENLAQKQNDRVKVPRKSPMDRNKPTASVAAEGISLDVQDIHSYSSTSLDATSGTSPAVDGVHVCAQTDNLYSHQSVTCDRPEISILDIKDSDESIQFYSGLPNYKTYKALFDTLLEYGMDVDIDKTGLRKKLSLEDEFLLVMMRLRLGLLVKDLEFRFKVSSSTVSRIFTKWIVFMRKAMDSLVYLPPLEILQRKVPSCFQSFSDTRIILDCTEIFIQTPSSLENKNQTYSHYKSHNTFKALVGITMTGAVCFLSKLWGGSASDVHITRESGLYDLLQPGDAVMVDKGFINIKSELEERHIKLYCPPLKLKKQFTKEMVETTRRIASARIHVERKMEQIKNFRLLQGTMPLALNSLADDIFFVCSALTNLLPPLVI